MLGNFSYLSNTLLPFTPSILTAQQDCIIFLSDPQQNNQSVWYQNSLFHYILLKFFLKWALRQLFLGKTTFENCFLQLPIIFLCTVILSNICSSFIFIIPSFLVHISSNLSHLKVNFHAERKTVLQSNCTKSNAHVKISCGRIPSILIYPDRVVISYIH